MADFLEQDQQHPLFPAQRVEGAINIPACTYIDWSGQTRFPADALNLFRIPLES